MPLPLALPTALLAGMTLRPTPPAPDSTAICRVGRGCTHVQAKQGSQHC